MAEPTMDEIVERLRAVENEVLDMAGLPEAVARVEGAVATLQEIVVSKMNSVQEHVERSVSVKSAITFASVVIVPILVALIGGYFVLKAGTK